MPTGQHKVSDRPVRVLPERKVKLKSPYSRTKWTKRLRKGAKAKLKDDTKTKGRDKTVMSKTTVDVERPELVEVITSTRSCQNKTYRTLDLLVMSLEGVTAILTADCSYNGVNVLYRRGTDERTSCLPLSDIPTQFSRVEENLVVTGVHSHSQIVFFRVFPGLHHMRTLVTEKAYYSPAYLHPSSLAVTCVQQDGSVQRPGIDIIDMDGQVLKTFSTKHFSQPYGICVHKNNILVADNWNEAIMSFTDNGKVNFKYRPTGKHALKAVFTVKANNGYIYTADWNNTRVVQLTEAGKFVKDVLTEKDDIDRPQAIYITADNLFYVTNAYSVIRVYRL